MYPGTRAGVVETRLGGKMYACRAQATWMPCVNNDRGSLRSHPRCLFGSRVEAWRRATRLLDIAAGAARALKDARTLKHAVNRSLDNLPCQFVGRTMTS